MIVDPLIPADGVAVELTPDLLETLRWQADSAARCPRCGQDPYLVARQGAVAVHLACKPECRERTGPLPKAVLSLVPGEDQ